MQVRIGRCSLCGGDVMSCEGAYHSTVPPGPPECASCGAIEASHDPVIPMAPRRPWGLDWPYRVTCEVVH